MKTLHALVLALAASACSAPSLEVVPRLGRLSPGGDMGFSTAGAAVAAQALEDGFGMETDASVLGGRVDLEAAALHLTGAYAGSDHDGQGVLSADIDYDGGSIPANTQVDTQFALSNTGVVATWDLLPTDAFELGFGFGANLVGVDARIAATDASLGLEPVLLDELLPIPVLALRGGARFGPVSLEALVSGVSISIADIDATYVDADLMAKWELLGTGVTGSLAAGWRYTSLDATFDDGFDSAEVNAAFSGPWIGVAVGF